MYSDTNVRWNEKDSLQCREPEIRFTFLRDIPSETFFLGTAGKDKYRYILTNSVKFARLKVRTGEFYACSVSRRVLDCSKLPCSKCTFPRTFSRALLRFFWSPGSLSFFFQNSHDFLRDIFRDTWQTRRYRCRFHNLRAFCHGSIRRSKTLLIGTDVKCSKFSQHF